MYAQYYFLLSPRSYATSSNIQLKSRGIRTQPCSNLVLITNFSCSYIDFSIVIYVLYILNQMSCDSSFLQIFSLLTISKATKQRWICCFILVAILISCRIENVSSSTPLFFLNLYYVSFLFCFICILCTVCY